MKGLHLEKPKYEQKTGLICCLPEKMSQEEMGLKPLSTRRQFCREHEWSGKTLWTKAIYNSLYHVNFTGNYASINLSFIFIDEDESTVLNARLEKIKKLENTKATAIPIYNSHLIMTHIVSAFWSNSIRYL